MKRLLCRLTEWPRFAAAFRQVTLGYPMRYSDEWFFDYWCWEPVDLYIDRLGRRWLAQGPWDLRRIQLKGTTK